MSSLSRLLLNPQKRSARKLLTSPQAMHAAVLAAFPPDIDNSTSRILWRLDSEGPTHTLYIQGPERPELTHLVEQAGWDSRPGETADLEPFLASLRLGQEWSFRLVANPVRSVSRGAGVRGKVIPHVTIAQQEMWLLERAERSGFEVLELPEGGPHLTVTRRSDLDFSKRDRSDPGSPQRRQVAVRTARFDGALRITDTEAIRRTVTSGIGRAKAYGCGLLSLARPH